MSDEYFFDMISFMPSPVFYWTKTVKFFFAKGVNMLAPDSGSPDHLKKRISGLSPASRWQQKIPVDGTL